MPTAIENIETLRSQCQSAMSVRDFQTAKVVASQILLELSLVPDGKKSGEAGAEASFDRTALLEFVNQVQNFAAQDAISSTGIVTTQIRYSRGDGVDCGGGCGY